LVDVPLPVKEPDSIFSCEICWAAENEFWVCRCGLTVCANCFNKRKQRCFTCTDDVRLEDRITKIEHLLEKLVGGDDEQGP